MVGQQKEIWVMDQQKPPISIPFQQDFTYDFQYDFKIFSTVSSSKIKCDIVVIKQLP